MEKPNEETISTVDAGMSDEELLAKYVELERFAEVNGESFTDGFVRVLHKKSVLARMASLASIPSGEVVAVRKALEDDLTEQELCELSCFMPNLACVIEREPPRMVEETRRAARQEVAALLREIVRLRAGASQ